MKHIFFTLLLICTASYSADECEELIIFNVGQGNCNLFIPLGKGFPTLYDAGSVKHPAVGGITMTSESIIKTISETIHSIMPDQKPTLNIVISHGDKDHHKYIGKIIKFLDDLQESNDDPKYKFHFFLGGKKEQYPDKLKKSIEELHPRRRLTYKYAGEIEGTNPTIEGYTSKFLKALESDDKNANSLVLKIAKPDKFSILLTGDATGDTTKDIKEADAKETTVMVANHHGADSEESNNVDWVTKTKPEIVIFSAAQGGYKHPKSSVIKNYHDSERLRKEAIHALSYSGDSVGDKRPTLCTYHSSPPHHSSLIRKGLFNTTDDGTFSIKFKTPPEISPEKPFTSFHSLKHLTELNFSDMAITNLEFLIFGRKILILSKLENFLLNKNSLEFIEESPQAKEASGVLKGLLSTITSLTEIDLREQSTPFDPDYLKEIVGEEFSGKLKFV